MFIVSDNTRLSNAKAKARETRPEVRVVTYGRYKVAGSEGDYYGVTVTPFGLRTGVDCACISGQHGNECYHAAAALLAHATLALGAAAAPAARDNRLAQLERDLRHIDRVASGISGDAGDFERMDEICRAVRYALRSLDEYEGDLLPALNEEAA